MARFQFFSSRRLWVKRRFNDIQATLAVTQNGSPPRRADWVYVVIFFLLGIAETFDAEPPGSGVRFWEFLALCAACASVPFRRTRPPYLFLLAVGLLAVGSILTPDTEFGMTGGVFLALAFSAYALCRWRPANEVYLGVVAILVVESISEVVRTGRLGDAIGSFTLWAVVLSIGVLMRYRRVLQLNQVEQARLSERNVLARELHDSVAHYVSAIAVQAQAAQYIAKNNPEAAVKAMAEVEMTANKAIDEMRRMVGVLRTTDDIARTVASTSLLDLADTSLYPAVEVSGEHDLTGLAPAVAAATYRVAQESVTNARKHGRSGTFIHVNCSIGPSEVVLQVSNDGVTGRSGNGGYGLVGMEERVRSLGGQISVGPAPQNTWSVVVRIPRETPRSTPAHVGDLTPGTNLGGTP